MHSPNLNLFCKTSALNLPVNRLKYAYVTISLARGIRGTFTCVYFGSARFGWSKCVTHRLLPPIAARQYSSGVHSKPLNTAFSRSGSQLSKPPGALWPTIHPFSAFRVEKGAVLHQRSWGSKVISMELHYDPTQISWQTRFLHSPRYLKQLSSCIEVLAIE